MLRSMSSAISGLRNHQTYMDVVGHNIANVNTVGYKASRINFKEALAQTYKVGSSPVAGGIGGTNPIQVGLGVVMGGVDTIMTQGSMTTTGKTTDLAIQGQGFFMLGTAETADSAHTGGASSPNATDDVATPSYFTRDGAFALDSSGYLVDPVSGNYVLGAKIGYFDSTVTGPSTSAAGAADFDGDSVVDYVDADGHWVDSDGNRLTSGTASTGEYTYDVGKVQIDPSWGWANFSISNDGKITGVKADGTTDTAHHPRVLVARFNNPEGLVRAGGNLFQAGLNSGDPIVAPPGDNHEGMGTLMSGTLEASNVDLAEQFSRMIMAERGFQANTRIITASDEMLQDLISMKR